MKLVFPWVAVFPVLLAVFAVAWCAREDSPVTASPERLEKRQGADAREGIPPRVEEFDRLLRIAKTEGPEAALAAAKAFGDQSNVLMLLNMLAHTDPAWVAGVFQDAGLSSAHRGFVIHSILRAWDDGVKAVAWVEADLEGSEYRMAYGRALGILLRTDLDGALSRLGELPPSETRRAVIADVFAAWVEIDPLAALNYVERMHEDDARGATWSALWRWCSKDRAAAAAWVAGHERPDAMMISVILRGWNQESAETIGAWLALIPDGVEKEEALARAEENRETPVVIRCGTEPIQPDANKETNKPRIK